MWYIVYREEFKTSYGKYNGYFVNYKNKIEDSYSPNWFEAKKYKALGAALHRMGIEIAPGVDTMEKFIRSNRLDHTAMRRDNIISEVLGIEKETMSLLFKRGRIDKVGSNGELLGSADEEVLEYIQLQLARNKARNDKKMKVVNEITGKPSGYIIETKEGEDFWEGF